MELELSTKIKLVGSILFCDEIRKIGSKIRSSMRRRDVVLINTNKVFQNVLIIGRVVL